jgi:hypothetical protein
MRIVADLTQVVFLLLGAVLFVLLITMLVQAVRKPPK